MTKIISLKSIIIWLLVTLMFLTCFIVLFFLPNTLLWLFVFFGGFVVIGIILIFTAQTKIVIDDQKLTIELIASPLTDPSINKENRRKKDEWNNKVNLSDIKDLTIRKVSREEKNGLLGSKFISNEYLVIKVKSGGLKFLHIAMFSNKQIAEIVKIINKYMQGYM